MDASLLRKSNSQLKVQSGKAESKSSTQDRKSEGSEDDEDSEDDDDDDDEKNDSSSKIGPARPHKKDPTSVAAGAIDEDATEKEVQQALQDSLRIAESSPALIVQGTKMNKRKATKDSLRNARGNAAVYEESQMRVAKEFTMPADASEEEAEEAAKEVDASLKQGRKVLRPRHRDSSRVVAFKARFPTAVSLKASKGRHAFRKKEAEIEMEIDPHAGEKALLLEKIDEIDKELSVNLYRQKCLKRRMEHLSSRPSSDKEIDFTAEKVAEETQSSAMANMLGNMWKELRMYEVPFYAQHVDEELRVLRHSEKVLEDRLIAAQAKYSAAQKKWEIEARRKRGIAAPAPAPAASEDSEDTASLSTSDEPQYVKLETKDDGDISVDPKVTPEPRSPERRPVWWHDSWLGGLRDSFFDMESELELDIKKAWREYDKEHNFWIMTWPEKEVVLRNTFIYLVFGCAFAILYRYIQLKNPGVLDAEHRGYLSPSDRDFSFSLFSCFGDLKTTGLAFCCSCCRWADTVDRQFGSYGVWQYWKAFGLMFILYVLEPFTAGLSILGMCVVGAIFRHALRVRFKMAHSTAQICCLDSLTWLFCMPCAIVQEAREEHLRYPGKPDDNLGLVPPSRYSGKPDDNLALVPPS